MSRILTTVELFCGIGGFRKAADAEGFSTIWANDNCPEACKIYRDNFGDNELDGKTVGSVIEKLLVAILEIVTFKDMNVAPLRACLKSPLTRR